MTYRELISQLATKLDLKPQEVAILLQEQNKIIADSLAAHTPVRIKNFGQLVVVKHKSRTVPDPRELTKKIVVFDQLLPKFRPSEQLRARVKSVVPQEGIESELAENNQLAQGTMSDVPLAHQSLSEPLSDTTTTSTATTQAEAPLAAEQPQVAASTAPTAATPQETTEQNQPATALPIEPERANPSTPDSDIGYADLTEADIRPDVLNLIPFKMAQKYQMVAIDQKDDQLIVAMIDPGDREAIDVVARLTGLTIVPKITTSDDLQHGFDQYNMFDDQATKDDETVAKETATKLEAANKEAAEAAIDGDDRPAIKAVTSILERAVREKASDIHIEPAEKKVIVRFRIDGILQKAVEVPKELQSAVISRLKIMSNLKIDESRLPQDGRLRMAIDSKEIDFRLSTLPTVDGEKIVMRILDKSGGVLSFEDLGLTGDNLKRVSGDIKKSHGMMLVTGPTGSGKTTTLYSVLGQIANDEVNVVTLEDPVEYRMAGINQSQVNSGIGYDFSSGLRTIVRQDPDVILIGEIRDLETATMAIHSALTGHIVLSTLHTNDAAGAIPRLIDMGIEPFLITSSTNAVIAQRLVRKICEGCKQEIKLEPEIMETVKNALGSLLEKNPNILTEAHFFKGKGCNKCNNSGYKGRFGIFEVLPMSEGVKELALKRSSSSSIAELAMKEGMLTLQQDGLMKVFAGQTTLEEVWRVSQE